MSSATRGNGSRKSDFVAGCLPAQIELLFFRVTAIYGRRMRSGGQEHV